MPEKENGEITKEHYGYCIACTAAIEEKQHGTYDCGTLNNVGHPDYTASKYNVTTDLENGETPLGLDFYHIGARDLLAFGAIVHQCNTLGHNEHENNVHENNVQPFPLPSAQKLDCVQRHCASAVQRTGSSNFFGDLNQARLLKSLSISFAKHITCSALTSCFSGHASERLFGFYDHTFMPYGCLSAIWYLSISQFLSSYNTGQQDTSLSMITMPSFCMWTSRHDFMTASHLAGTTSLHKHVYESICLMVSEGFSRPSHSESVHFPLRRSFGEGLERLGSSSCWIY